MLTPRHIAKAEPDLTIVTTFGDLERGDQIGVTDRKGRFKFLSVKLTEPGGEPKWVNLLSPRGHLESVAPTRLVVPSKRRLLAAREASKK